MIDVVDNCFKSVRPEFELHLTDSIEVDVDSALQFHVKKILLPQDRLLI